FDIPLGLFMDIGGGSVEIALGSRSKMRSLFSVPLGAVRLTEHFLKNDPPLAREIVQLNREIRHRLEPVAKRASRHNFSMAFGSGGTMTALADADARFTGESPKEALYVLRYARLKTLFDLLCTQPLDGVNSIIPDSKRGDILVAGAAVLLSMMSHFS